MARAIEGLTKIHHHPSVTRSILRHPQLNAHIRFLDIKTNPQISGKILAATNVHPDEYYLSAILPRVLDERLNDQRRRDIPNMIFIHEGTPSGVATRESGYPFFKKDLESLMEAYGLSYDEAMEQYGHQLPRTNNKGHDLNRSFLDIDKEPEAWLHHNLVSQNGPIPVGFYFHNDKDLIGPKARAIYIYIHSNKADPFPVEFVEKYRRAMKKNGFLLFNGPDDMSEPDLGNQVVDGVVYTYTDEVDEDNKPKYASSLEHDMVDKRLMRWALTLEFPIANHTTLKKMTEVIVDELVFPLGCSLLQ